MDSLYGGRRATAVAGDAPFTAAAAGGGGPLRRLHAFDLWRRVDVVLSFSD